MLDSLSLPVLMAQEQSPFFEGVFKFLYMAGVLLLVIVLPIVLGSVLAKWLRMRGYEWKLGLIFVMVTIALFIVTRAFDFAEGKFRMPMGVDLKGGVILIYEVQVGGGTAGQPDEEEDSSINMGDLVQALTNRINPSGTKEIVIRPYGERQVEIIIPEVDAAEVDSIKRQISTAGNLEFRIVANVRDHQDIIALAEAQSQDAEPATRISKHVMRDKEQVGFWAQAAKEKLKAVELEGNILRNSATGEMIDVRSLGPIQNSEQLLADYLAENGLENVDILVATNDGCNVTGGNLGMVAASTDEYLSPCVNFRLKGEGVAKFQLLTSSNLPDNDSTPPFYRHLGIILDERIISFPRLITTISDSGRITGNFTQEEVTFLVGILRAGKLPATLTKEPISENQIGSMLGEDTIQKGKLAVGVSMIAVLAFTAFYYRFCGLVACMWLMVNLLFVFAVMILVNAPLTMSGLAGLALTVGMAVDANVLIFERIREEINRGAGVRMAIRNGFDRATVTIVDSNLTTLITAITLYVIGTDQIRGFAVTLTLGILTGMFTAIFCSRVVFDISERRGWITELRMMRILGSTHIDFMSKRYVCFAISAVLIVVGLVATVARGKSLFDIDFTGGVSVTMVLQDSMPADQVRTRIDSHFQKTEPPIRCTVNTVSVEGRPRNSVYKIDAGLDSTAQLEQAIEEAFQDDRGNSLLLSYAMDFADVKPVVAAAPTAESPEMPETTPASKAATVPESAETVPAEPSQTPAAPADPVPADGTPTPEAPAPADQTAPAAETAPADQTEPEPAPTADGASDAADDQTDTPAPGGPRLSQRRDLPPDTWLAWAGPLAAQDETTDPADPAPAAADTPDPPQAAAPEAEQPVTEVTPPTAAAEMDPPAAESAAPTEEPEATTAPAEVRSVAKLTFGDAINAPTLRDNIKLAYNEIHPVTGEGSKTAAATGTDLTVDVPGLLVDTDEFFDWDQTSAALSKEWYVRLVATPEETQRILQRMKQDLANTPVFPSSNKVGGQVAGDTRNLAVVALAVSCLGIILYLWIRFQHVIFGVAAVAALVHDVLITVGAIAVSAYVANSLGFLLIDEFKINLTLVAALLTIIGYSVNDTIVVFDRIREVRGKSPDVTTEVVNTSINQTLSRTLLTSFTTLIVTVILYMIGGSGIHGFAFAFTIGIMVGTYSSIYIASPIMLWMLNREKVTV
ncbi:MAG: protein translocase subunit SecD [Pirellulaceae bacterium]